MRKTITLLAMFIFLGLVSLGVYRHVTLEKALAQSDRPLQYRYSAYWTTAYGFESTIELHNNLVNEPLTVTPVLYTASGAAIELDEVRMGILGSASVESTRPWPRRVSANHCQAVPFSATRENLAALFRQRFR